MQVAPIWDQTQEDLEKIGITVLLYCHMVLVCYANVVLLVQKLLCEILCAIYKCIAAVFLEINSNTV